MGKHLSLVVGFWLINVLADIFKRIRSFALLTHSELLPDVVSTNWNRER